MTRSTVGVQRLKVATLAVSLALAAPGWTQASSAPPLQALVEAKLREAGPGTRFGLVVADEQGRELITIAPDNRFIPASNTKIFTTAAAFDTLPEIDAPDSAGGARVRLEPGRRRAPDVILEGRGDARLSAGPDCIDDCLAALADAVAAKTRVVGDVIGDDRYFPDDRWSQGMSWNNIATRSGTAISALTIDHNELALRVSPAALGKPPRIEIGPYLSVNNQAVTTAEGKTELNIARLPGSRIVLLTGTIAVGAETELIRLGIDDPAHYAAWRLAGMLAQKGVRQTGAVLARHLPSIARKFAPAEPPDATAEPLARLTPGPLADDIKIVNKVSQNVHSELLLRRVGRVAGTGSTEDGLAAVYAMLERAGVPRHAYHLADGSGMSTYNRVSPRGMVTLLRWIAARPWGQAWRATLPVGGVDGTLANRFRGTALHGRVFAKTGTLNATNALAGYMLTRSGRTLTFAAYANDVPEEVAATKSMDAALALFAEAN